MTNSGHERKPTELQRDQLLELQLVSAVLDMDDAAFRLAAARIRKDPKLRGQLTNILGQQPIPPILQQALRRQRSRVPVAVSVASTLNEHLVKQFRIDETAEASFSTLIHSGRAIEAEHGLATVRAWLLYLMLVGGPLDPLVEALLLADSPWQCHSLDKHTKVLGADAPSVAEVGVMLADGAPDADGYFSTTVRAFRASLNALLDGSGTNGDRERARWLLGSAIDEFDASDEEPTPLFELPTEELPPLPAWPGQPPVDLDQDEVTQTVQLLLERAETAAAEARRAAAERRAPTDEQILTQWRAAAAARQLAAACDHGGPPLELAAEIEAARRPGAALRRLAHVSGAAGAEDAAERLRSAARTALQGGETPESLMRLAGLLDAGSRPAFEDIQQLLAQVPAELHGALLAASHGLLKLPDENDSSLGESERAPSGEPEPATASRDETVRTAEAGPSESQRLEVGADDPDANREERVDGVDRAEVAGTSPAGADPDQQSGSEPSAEPDELAQDIAAPAVREPEPGPAVSPESPSPQREADPQGPSEPEQEPADEPVDEEGRARLLRRLLDDNRDPAGAFWVATATDDDPGLQAATETLTYALAMRREGGPAGLAFDEAATRLPGDQLLAHRAARILTVTAALRATLVAPYTARSFLDGIADRYKKVPALSEIITAVSTAALAGARIGSVKPADATDVEGGSERAALCERAAELLDVGPDRKLGYQPATRVWQRWIDARQGWLGQMLAVVVDDDRSRAEDLKAKVATARDDRWLIDQLNAADRDERGVDARGIEYFGRDSLLRRTRAHLDLIADWLELAELEDAAGPSDWSEQQAAELCQSIQRCRDEAMAEIGDVGEDQLAAAAAALAGDVLNELFDRLLSARPYPGREQNPAEVLARPLLRTDLPLDITGWTPERTPDFDDLTVLGDAIDWVASFERRLARGDLAEAASIITIVAQTDGENAAEELRFQLEEATERAAREVSELWRQAREQLTRAKREGFLDASTATSLDQRLDELDITNEGDRPGASDDRPRRIDIGPVLRSLRQFGIDLQRQRDERIASRRAEVLRAAQEGKIAPVISDEALRLIDDGKLVEAEEVIRQADKVLFEASADGDLAGVGAKVAVNDDVAALLADPQPVDDALREAIETKGSWHGLRFDRLHDQVRDRRIYAVDGWEHLRNQATLDVTDATAAVRSVLGGLGMELSGRAVSRMTRSGGRHRWYDVEGATVRATRTAQFGSLARGRYRVLVTPESVAVDQVVEVIAAEAGDRRVIHLHLGVWNLSDRHRYAQLLARAELDALPVDATVFAARLARPEEAWGVTCGLALPFGATNPYLVDVAGSDLPPEMFFGRASEQRRLLDPNGPNIVFGGRQLGKTALLRQAEAVFANYGDHSLSVYVDINIVGANNDPHRVWNHIYQELSRHLDADMNAAPTLAEGVVAGVRAWLDEDDEHRLLILLDEADRFLRAEQPDFQHVNRLKNLMEVSHQRCKVVFAGLHSVGRFQRDPNHPFAHMGRPIGVGGLDPRDAFALVIEPLAELGFVPDSEDVVLRAVTFANYHPAVLQHFGHELTKRLQARRPGTAPPWSFSTGDVDEILGHLADRIASLLDMTLDLDDRYGVIAYAMAKRDREQGSPSAMTVDEIVVAAKDAGVQGSFTEPGRADEVTALLDEMQHLGVLRRPEGGRYQLRSRYITMMLGSDDEVVQKLIHYVGKVNNASEQAFDPGRDRQMFPGDRCRVFPLTFLQVQTFCSPSSSHHALVGSLALGIDDVEAALKAVTLSMADTEVLPTHTLTNRRGAGEPPRHRDEIHRIVIGDVRTDQRSKVDRALAEADRWATDESLVGTVCTLLLLDVRQIDLLRALLIEQPQPETAGPTSFRRLTPLVALHRLNAAAVRAWAHNAELELPPGDHTDVVLHETGGWPLLVSRAASRAGQSGLLLADAATQVGSELEDRDAAAAFVAATGADQLDDVSRAAWELLATYGQTSVDDFDEAYMEETGSSKKTAARERRLLTVLGLADVADGTIFPEQRLVRAWSTARG